MIVSALVSIGTWAGPEEMKTGDIGNWFDNNNQSVPAERVIYIKVHDSNQLKNTLNELKEILTTADPNTLEPEWKKNYYNALDVATINNNQYSGMVANKKLILKVVFEKGNGANDPETLVLNDAAKTALASIDVPTIDLQDAKIESANAFAINNPYVRNLILPDGWGKEQVNAAVGGCNNLGSAFSMGTSSVYQLNDNGNISDGATVTAYVKTPGTLFDATRRSGYENHSNTKLGSIDVYTWSLHKTTVAIFSGYPSARDYSGDNVVCDAYGHFEFDKEADENAANGEGAIYNAAVGGGERSLVGTSKSGALMAAALVVLDLGDAIIDETHCSDLTFPKVGSLGAKTEKVVLPTYSGLKTIPADCMNFASKVRDICIPGNIEYIKTRAFNSSGAYSRLSYVWTTGNDPKVKYDNGACFTDGADYICHDEVGYVANGCLYGTFTLPPNLKLIERFAFGNSITVHDVYVLNETAPECHVDAFSQDMYVGNNTYLSSAIVDGIITRDAYIQGDPANHRFTTMLHYPRSTRTPNTQRYTDPSREYSVATGERDGNGNMIYFPNQSEFVFAYLQGSYGYVWKAWDDARNWFDNEITLGYGDGFALDKAAHSPVVENGQSSANGLWTSNASEMIETGDNAGHLEKFDRTFYDLTTGSTNQFNEVSAPTGDLRPYYEVKRNGTPLYPQAETEGVVDDQGNPVMETVPVRDANGDIVYDELPSGSSYEGNYTRATVQEYYKADDGVYCHQLNQDNNGQYTIGYEYTPNTAGAYCKAPWDATGNTWTTWDTWMGDIPRYDRKISGIIPFDSQTHNDGRPRFNISNDYVEYDSYNNEYKQYLDRYNVRDKYVYSAANNGDPEPYYQMQTQQVQAQNVVKQNDYRGWHQFVLVATAHNSTEEFEPLRSFINDNDWWTICEPYDLRYSDLVKFFGTDNGIGTPKIPYLCKLMYVIRDVENEKITLMFSKNLMKYMEYEVVGGVKKSINEGTHVHGWIDDQTEWPAQNDGKYLGQPGYDPIILHAGVPYLIRPNLTVDAQGNVNATRQFDVYKTDNEDLYNRLHDAQEMSGSEQKELVYKGIYTVPSYVVGLDNKVVNENTISAGTSTITMKDGSSFTYKNSTEASSTDVKPVYGGSTLTKYEISDDFTYSFVGSFYKSVIPRYSYFLGWDSEKNHATFWYSKEQDVTGWNWNNETGVICPNFNTNLKIHAATGLSDPARWIVTAGTDIESDDFPSTGGGNAKIYTMEMGAANFFDDGEATGITELNTLPETSELRIYNANGVYMGNSLKGLAKGIYIVNGKKYVVK